MIKHSILHPVIGRLIDPHTGEPLIAGSSGYVSPSNCYPIIRGVPRFVPSDAYVNSFSLEWNTHTHTQLDVFRADRSSEQQFVAKTGFSSDELRGKLVLDAGVGAGRFADIASRWGAQLAGIDLSYAVEASSATFQDRPNVWIAQADIGNLPFKHESFDIIFSIGVLHHTPNTEAYFRKLVPLLKPGGTIAIWVYPKEGDYVVRNEWIRFVNKIPPRMFYAWCRWFVPWAQARPSSRLAGLFKRIFPFSEQGLGLENDILDTYDGYSPKFHGIHTPEEVEHWFRNCGLVNVHSPSDWRTCMRGTKPIETEVAPVV